MGRSCFVLVILVLCSLSFAGVRTDTVSATNGIALIVKDTTRFTKKVSTPIATIDTSKTRHAVADSATIPVFKGTETHRDSSYFASGLRGLRLYFPQADIDSLIGDVKIGGKVLIGGYVGIGTNNPLTNVHVVGGIATFNGSAIAFSVGSSGSSNDISLQNYANSAKTVNIKSDGPSYITGSLKVAACTTSTINTGNGDAKVYPVINGTFACSLFDNNTYKISTTAYYSKTGNYICIYIPQLYETVTSGVAKIKGFPDILRSSNKVFRIPIQIIDDSITKIGTLQLAPIGNTIFLDNGNFTYGTCGVDGISFCYNIF